MAEESRAAAPRDPLPRRYLMLAAVVASLVLALIFLFGHLISTSLSRRYVEDVIHSGQEEASHLADQLGEEAASQLEVSSKRREELVLTLAGLPQRRIIESIEVRDSSGEVIFTSDFNSAETLPEELVSSLELRGRLPGQNVIENETSYSVSSPLGGVGEVVLNFSKRRMAARVMQLRRELLQQTAVIASLTFVTLMAAFALVWVVIQRARRLERQRRQAEELAHLGSLAANLAHEIRNPLNSINLNLEMLEEDLRGESTERGVSSLANTRQEVGRLARLVSDFLSYARPAPPVLSPVPVGRLLRDTAEFLRVEVRKAGIDLRLAPPPPEVAVEADVGQLRQVLLNLVLNATRAVGEQPPERRVVEMGAVVANGSVRLAVSDRGDGVPEEELDRLREVFYSRQRGGSGLGLAIADRIATAHGGRLELRNLKPFGFEAAVVLPNPSVDVKMTERADERGDGGRRRRRRSATAESDQRRLA